MRISDWSSDVCSSDLTSIYATDASGRVVYSTVARVGNNIETIDQMLTLAMPEAKIAANTMNGFVLLTGTVQSPDDAAEAERLGQAFVGEQTKEIGRASGRERVWQYV